MWLSVRAFARQRARLRELCHAVCAGTMGRQYADANCSFLPWYGSTVRYIETSEAWQTFDQQHVTLSTEMAHLDRLGGPA